MDSADMGIIGIPCPLFSALNQLREPIQITILFWRLLVAQFTSRELDCVIQHVCVSVHLLIWDANVAHIQVCQTLCGIPGLVLTLCWPT